MFFFLFPINASAIFGKSTTQQDFRRLTELIFPSLSLYFPCPHREWFYALLVESFSYALGLSFFLKNRCTVTRLTLVSLPRITGANYSRYAHNAYGENAYLS